MHRAPAFLLILVSSTALADITGKPRIIDGDTIVIAGERIRLHGIDAPESRQTCTVDGKEWACGNEATQALAFETAEHWVRCEARDKDRYGRTVAVCFVGPYDLGERMVRKGWALAYRRYSKDYVDEEDAAREEHLGMYCKTF